MNKVGDVSGAGERLEMVQRMGSWRSGKQALILAAAGEETCQSGAVNAHSASREGRLREPGCMHISSYL